MTNSLSNGPERQLTDHHHELFFKFDSGDRASSLAVAPGSHGVPGIWDDIRCWQ